MANWLRSHLETQLEEGFKTWQDKATSALPITDNDIGLPGATGAAVSFLDLVLVQGEANPGSLHGDALQANRIVPEPCHFLDPALGPVAILRRASTNRNGAVAAIQGLVDDHRAERSRVPEHGLPVGEGGRRRSPGALIRIAWRSPVVKDLRQLVRPGLLEFMPGPLLGF